MSRRNHSSLHPLTLTQYWRKLMRNMTWELLLATDLHLCDLVCLSSRTLSRASQRLFMIRPQTMFYRTDRSEIINSVHQYGIIRPVLEYASIIWNPWLCKDILALDSVQRKCEKLYTDCELWLTKESEPLSLEETYRFDLIETCKFINNKYKTDPQSLFSLPYRKLRGHRQDIQAVCKNWYTDYRSNFCHIVWWIPGIYCLLR